VSLPVNQIVHGNALEVILMVKFLNFPIQSIKFRDDPISIRLSTKSHLLWRTSYFRLDLSQLKYYFCLGPFNDEVGVNRCNQITSLFAMSLITPQSLIRLETSLAGINSSILPNRTPKSIFKQVDDLLVGIFEGNSREILWLLHISPFLASHSVGCFSNREGAFSVNNPSDISQFLLHSVTHQLEGCGTIKNCREVME